MGRKKGEHVVQGILAVTKTSVFVLVSFENWKRLHGRNRHDLRCVACIIDKTLQISDSCQEGQGTGI